MIVKYQGVQKHVRVSSDKFKSLLYIFILP